MRDCTGMPVSASRECRDQFQQRELALESHDTVEFGDGLQRVFETQRWIVSANRDVSGYAARAEECSE